MLHCVLGVQWKVASDLRFRAAISEPKTPSFCRISGDLAHSTRKSLAIAIVRFWCAKSRAHLLQYPNLRRNRPLTLAFVKSIAIHLPFLSRCFCKSMPSSGQKLVYTPPICITIRPPYVSQYFCRSIRVRNRWKTPQLNRQGFEIQPANDLKSQRFESLQFQLQFLRLVTTDLDAIPIATSLPPSLVFPLWCRTVAILISRLEHLRTCPNVLSRSLNLVQVGLAWAFVPTKSCFQDRLRLNPGNCQAFWRDLCRDMVVWCTKPCAFVRPNTWLTKPNVLTYLNLPTKEGDEGNRHKKTR